MLLLQDIFNTDWKPFLWKIVFDEHYERTYYVTTIGKCLNGRTISI